jgi:hypothetical protein
MTDKLKRCCSTCDNLRGEIFTLDYHYPTVWCSKSHPCELESSWDELDEEVDCKDWRHNG